MASKGTTVWVSQETKARLRAIAEGIVRETEENRRTDFAINPEPINPAGCGLSADAVINYLIDQLLAHRREAKESRERAKQRKASEGK